MRKIKVLTFLTLDGVMQSPGAPEEDPSGGFEQGGWLPPYFDETLGEIMGKEMSEPFDLLLGRKTFDIFASYWPQHKEEGPGINNATKYVASETPFTSDWETTIVLEKDVVEKVKELKKSDGPELQVHGSGNFIQTLLKHDLVDEFHLKIFPVTVGAGKRLFDRGTLPAAFKVTHFETTPAGVLVVSYIRDGNLKSGSVIE
jgi:dihydrofolate reductase